jgi:hypothetical protein
MTKAILASPSRPRAPRLPAEVGLAAERVAYLPTLDNPYRVFGPGGAHPGTGHIEPGPGRSAAWS